ncbi:MAG: hypothetical protein J6Q94_04060 [Clostridia bacterium]|nr:hypothetical protein [Clostridia bacterium]
MSKTVITIIVSVVVVSVAATGIGVFVASRPSPEKTIERFEAAYNEALFEDMVACFEPSVQILYSGISGVVDSLFGVNPSDIMNIIGGVMPFIDGQVIDGEYYEMPKLDIEVVDAEEYDDYAEVYVTVTMTYYGETESYEGEMSLVFVEDDWYLCAENLMS